MISYHLNTSMHAGAYGSGFRTADTLDMNRIAKCAQKFVWSPSIWRNGHRNKDNFIQAQICALDFDDDETTLEQALKIFCDAAHIIGPTKSHRLVTEKNPTGCDRFRVVLLFDRAIADARLYKWNMKKLVDRYSSDLKCIDAGRYFFPCREISSVQNLGYAQEVYEDMPEDFDVMQQPVYREIELARGLIPSYVYRDFERSFRYFNRNQAVFFFALAVAPFKFPPQEILERIKRTRVFSKYPVGIDDDSELLRTIRNGLKAANKGVNA